MSTVLTDLSSALAGLAESVGANTVRVEARRRQSATGIVYSPDGVIVTAHHVVERDENISVGLPDGSSVAATLVGRDPGTDLAVLRVQASGLKVPSWGEDKDLKVGHFVLALGRPGETIQATQGIVSALGDGFRTSSGGKIDRYIQTDVAMYPGFSGGPLVGMSGAIFGINTSATMRGVSLAIPTATVRRVTETLLRHGHVKRGYLGVSTQPVKLPGALAKELDQETGLLVISVEADSPADKGGLLLGDTLVTFDNQPVRGLDDLMGSLSGDTVGSPMRIKIVRGGQLQELTVTVGERS